MIQNSITHHHTHHADHQRGEKEERMKGMGFGGKPHLRVRGTSGKTLVETACRVCGCRLYTYEGEEPLCSKCAPKPAPSAPELRSCPVCGMPAYGSLYEYEGEKMCYSCYAGIAGGE
jgi:uncharacterized Zn finger protein (UPF0148 family)